MSSRDCHRTEREENVATTQVEYLAVALDKAEEGFDEPTRPAFEHATDMLLVRNAYAGGEAVAHLV